MDTPFELTPTKLDYGAYIKDSETGIESIEPTQLDQPHTETKFAGEDSENFSCSLETSTQEAISDPWYEKTWEALKRNKVVTVAGAIAVGSLAANPIGDTIETVKDVAPYVGTGLLIGEAGWIGGAAMMLATGGKKMLNPLKIKSAFKDTVDSAEDSKLFKTGFALNLGSAIAQFAIPTVAVTANMPPQTWGVLAVGAIDLWATVVLRRAIWKGVHKNQSP